METRSSDPAAILRRAGLRVTAARLAVLSALAANAPHPSADTIVATVRERLGDSSAQTVYNVLRAFTDVGLVRRIEPAGHPGLYELRVGDNHHHIVCRSCGAIADVDCTVGVAPCLTAADNAGYAIDEAEVIFWGRCPACIAAAPVPPSGGARTGGMRRERDAAPNGALPRARAERHRKDTPRQEKDRHG